MKRNFGIPLPADRSTLERGQLGGHDRPSPSSRVTHDPIYDLDIDCGYYELGAWFMLFAVVGCSAAIVFATAFVCLLIL